MRTRRNLYGLSMVALGVLVCGRPLAAQTVLVTVDQSYASPDRLSSPTAVARFQVDRLDGACVGDGDAPFCGGRTMRGMEFGLNWTLP